MGGGQQAVKLTILISSGKTLDDVIRIARVEGRKKLGCDVHLLDVRRESAEKFVVSVLPKYRGFDVEARSGMQAE